MAQNKTSTGIPAAESFSPIQDMTYEQAFSELEAVVAALESNDRALAEAMAFYQRGQELAKYCTQQLDQAELKVQKITGEELVDVDF
jgi:exodeoxyribonuclease VII small subunit